MMKTDITYIFLSIFIMGCADTSPLQVNSIPPKKTFVKEETQSLDNNQKKAFDKKLEYRNNFGDDFGYFDTQGYYCNHIYYPYDERYRYEDRLYHRGYFRPTVRHIRVYNEEDNGNGYYYPVPSSSSRVRVMHPEHLEERHIGSGGYSNLRYDENNK